ncbi:hypothetical protein BDR22DRAFT_864170 [Usnea florida]
MRGTSCSTSLTAWSLLCFLGATSCHLSVRLTCWSSSSGSANCTGRPAGLALVRSPSSAFVSISFFFWLCVL